MEHATIRDTVFGEVLIELLEKRGIEPTPGKIDELAERSAIDGWALIARMSDPDAGHLGYLDALARVLHLSDAERTQLACAFSFERRAEVVLEPGYNARRAAALRS